MALLKTVVLSPSHASLRVTRPPPPPLISRSHTPYIRVTRKGKLKLKREESEESPEDDQITHSGLSIVGGSILLFAWLAIQIVLNLLTAFMLSPSHSPAPVLSLAHAVHQSDAQGQA